MSFKGHTVAIYLYVLKCDLFPFCTLGPSLRNKKVDLGIYSVILSHYYGN